MTTTLVEQKRTESVSLNIWSAHLRWCCSNENEQPLNVGVHSAITSSQWAVQMGLERFIPTGRWRNCHQPNDPLNTSSASCLVKSHTGLLRTSTHADACKLTVTFMLTYTDWLIWVNLSFFVFFFNSKSLSSIPHYCWKVLIALPTLDLMIHWLNLFAKAGTAHVWLRAWMHSHQRAPCPTHPRSCSGKCAVNLNIFHLFMQSGPITFCLAVIFSN